MEQGITRRRSSEAGFTLIELMIVVVIIGILAAVGIPMYINFQENAKVGRTASELRSLSQAFVAYYASTGSYPPDSHLTLPTGMDEYINPAIWANGTPIGGTYNWEGPDGYPYAGLSIFTTTPIDNDKLIMLDHMLDDGDLGQGQFRVMGNGRPTYVIEE